MSIACRRIVKGRRSGKLVGRLFSLVKEPTSRKSSQCYMEDSTGNITTIQMTEVTMNSTI